jgi:hypothetical protein
MKPTVSLDIACKWRVQRLASGRDPIQNSTFQALRVIRSCTWRSPLYLFCIKVPLICAIWRCDLLACQYAQYPHQSLPSFTPWAQVSFEGVVWKCDVPAVLCMSHVISILHPGTKIDKQTHVWMPLQAVLEVLPCTTTRCWVEHSLCTMHEWFVQNVCYGVQGGP